MRLKLTQFFKQKFQDPRFLIRATMIVGFLLLMSLLLPRSFHLDFEYELGKKWEYSDLSAPFDFVVFKTEEELKQDQKKALEQVLLVYSYDSLQSQKAISSFASLVEGYVVSQKVKSDTTHIIPSWVKPLNTTAAAFITSVYEKGLIAGRRDTFQQNFVTVMVQPTRAKTYALDNLILSADVEKMIVPWVSGLPPDRQTLAKTFLKKVLTPNFKPNQVYYQEERKRVERMIVRTIGEVKTHELIIHKGEVVGNEEARKLESLAREKEYLLGNQSGWQQFFGQFFIVSLLVFFLLNYLVVNKPRVYSTPKLLGLIFLMFLLVVFAMITAVKLGDLLNDGPEISLIYMAPTCIMALVIVSFFDIRTAVVCNLTVALLGAILIQGGLEFAFVQICAGTTAAYSLRRLQNRIVFFYALGYILLAYCISYEVFNFFTKESLYEFYPGDLLVFVFNLALTIFAYPLIYLFEKVFGITSDLTYLELMDTNHPLLRKMSQVAPGTFQHSLQVANIAEAAINVIGGNALLLRVAALFHDIGKIENPTYFIENAPREESPHEKLSPEESAKIIIAHVKKGVIMARKHGLPEEIISFISSHHGTTRMEYFYRKYLKKNQLSAPEGEKQFKYPGPKPATRESAVLMIADSVEAASRSLKDPDEESLEKLMNKIIDYKIEQKQFENSPLTFQDLTQLRKVILKQLIGIYHERIVYPKEG